MTPKQRNILIVALLFLSASALQVKAGVGQEAAAGDLVRAGAGPAVESTAGVGRWPLVGILLQTKQTQPDSRKAFSGPFSNQS